MVINIIRILDNKFSSLDVSSQKAVYASFYRLAYGVAMHITNDHWTAEDIVHDALLKVLYHPPIVDTDRQFMVWIKVVARNLAISAVRQRKNYLFFTDEVHFLSDNITTVEQVVETKLLLQHVRECIGELNPAYRKIMEWKWNEKSNREIALRFKLTEGAVKQKLHRARKTLEKKLYQRWQFPNKGSPNVP